MRARALNPVLRRELIERWRSPRATATLTVYLAVLAGLQYLLYWAGQRMLSGFGFGGEVDAFTAGPLLGRFLLDGLLFFVLLLVLFVAPGYAATQLSGERERRTLPLLQATLLRPVQIVVGKLGASTAWLSLLVTAALPLGAAAFFLGGVALGDLLRGVLFIAAVGVAVAAMALGISAVTRRTSASVVLTYGLVLALTLGTLLVAGVSAAVGLRDGRPVGPPAALYLNPFYGLADAARANDVAVVEVLPSPLGLLAAALPGGGFVRSQAEHAVAEPVPFGEVDVAVAPRPPVMLEQDVRPDDPRDRPQVWLRVLGLYLGLGLAGLGVATARLRTGEVTALPRRTPRRTAAAPAAEPAPAKEAGG